MKYLINIPESCVIRSPLKGEVLGIPLLLSATQKTYTLPTEIQLEPYTEPDRKAIEDEVWEFAMKCLSMDGSEFCDVFDSCDALCLTNYSYQDAKARYESWKAEREQILVGDEVEYDCNGRVRFVVLGIVGRTAYGFKYPCDCDDAGDYCDIDELTKTGRHFPEVAELLKKMRDTE